MLYRWSNIFCFIEANYVSSTSDCHFVPIIECTASCELALSCWGVTTDNDAFIHCKWNSTNEQHHVAAIEVGSEQWLVVMFTFRFFIFMPGSMIGICACDICKGIGVIA